MKIISVEPNEPDLERSISTLEKLQNNAELTFDEFINAFSEINAILSSSRESWRIPLDTVYISDVKFLESRRKLLSCIETFLVNNTLFDGKSIFEKKFNADEKLERKKNFVAITSIFEFVYGANYVHNIAEFTNYMGETNFVIFNSGSICEDFIFYWNTFSKIKNMHFAIKKREDLVAIAKGESHPTFHDFLDVRNETKRVIFFLSDTVAIGSIYFKHQTYSPLDALKWLELVANNITIFTTKILANLQLFCTKREFDPNKVIFTDYE